MKKFLLLLLIPYISFAYTPEDVSTANELAQLGLISDHSSRPENYRLDDAITRAEVVGTALKLAGVELPQDYACNKYYSDTTGNDWICRAVELAADRNYVTRLHSDFRPQDKITKSESLAILMKAVVFPDITEEEEFENFHHGKYLFSEANKWQNNLLKKAYFYGVGDLEYREEPQGRRIYDFAPNQPATRAQVFGFAHSIVELRNHMPILGKLFELSSARVIQNGSYWELDTVIRVSDMEKYLPGYPGHTGLSQQKTNKAYIQNNILVLGGEGKLHEYNSLGILYDIKTRDYIEGLPIGFDRITSDLTPENPLIIRGGFNNASDDYEYHYYGQSFSELLNTRKVFDL